MKFKTFFPLSLILLYSYESIGYIIKNLIVLKPIWELRGQFFSLLMNVVEGLVRVGGGEDQ